MKSIEWPQDVQSTPRSHREHPCRSTPRNNAARCNGSCDGFRGFQRTRTLPDGLMRSLLARRDLQCRRKRPRTVTSLTGQLPAVFPKPPRGEKQRLQHRRTASIITKWEIQIGEAAIRPRHISTPTERLMVSSPNAQNGRLRGSRVPHLHEIMHTSRLGQYRTCSFIERSTPWAFEVTHSYLLFVRPTRVLLHATPGFILHR